MEKISHEIDISARNRLTNFRENARSEIVILHKNGVAKQVIANFVCRNIRTVDRWIHRTENNSDVSDKPRSGRPFLYDAALRQRLIAFYCQTSPLPGVGRWTLRWAEQHLSLHPELVGSPLLRSTISRILNEQNLKPHRSKYFLQITDPDFFPKMERLIRIYKNMPKNLFCFDECTGIQVLLRIAPDACPELSEEQKKGWLKEFEYIRNGTIDLLAFMNVRTGKVNVSCKGDHTKTTFINCFEKQVETVPKNEKIEYIMDNLAGHYSYDFCVVVAKLSNVACPSKIDLDTGAKRRQWLQLEDKRIVIHFTPFHGSWLNMVEIWFGILGAKCLKESYSSPDEMIQAIYSFAEIWDTDIGHGFKWKYDGFGLHEKVVHRFIRFLNNSSEKLHI